MAEGTNHEHVDRLTIACTRAGKEREDWRSFLAAEGRRWAEATSTDAVVRITERMENVDISESHVAQTMSSEVPFDLTLSVWAPAIDATTLSWSPSAEPFLAQHRSRMAVSLGWQCHFFGVTDSYVLQTQLHRRKGMSHADMSTYWHDVHTGLGTYPRFRGYHQYHIEETPTRAAATALGLRELKADGITEPYFDSSEHLSASMSDPRMKVPAADEPNFLDSATCQYTFATVEYVTV